jgi:hypothetical protein
MEYLPDEAIVIYHSKDGNDIKTYDALEWTTAMGTHVPLRGGQTLSYYGSYSNSSRRRRFIKETPKELHFVSA